MASPGNRHCANCIGALSFRVWLIPHDHSLPRVTCLSAQRFVSCTKSAVTSRNPVKRAPLEYASR